MNCIQDTVTYRSTYIKTIANTCLYETKYNDTVYEVITIVGQLVADYINFYIGLILLHKHSIDIGEMVINMNETGTIENLLYGTNRQINK